MSLQCASVYLQYDKDPCLSARGWLSLWVCVFSLWSVLLVCSIAQWGLFTTRWQEVIAGSKGEPRESGKWTKSATVLSLFLFTHSVSQPYSAAMDTERIWQKLNLKALLIWPWRAGLACWRKSREETGEGGADGRITKCSLRKPCRQANRNLSLSLSL